MARIPTTVPGELYAGDLWKWNPTIAEYSAADGYALTYIFSGPGATTVTADVVAGAFVVSKLSDESLPAGVYKWIARITKGVGAAAERYTAGQGAVTIRAAAPGQNRAEKLLGLVDAVIENRLTGKGPDVTAYSIDGLSLQKMSLQELESLRTRYANQVAAARRGGKVFQPVTVRYG